VVERRSSVVELVETTWRSGGAEVGLVVAEVGLVVEVGAAALLVGEPVGEVEGVV
jgi:hypothetical protein